MAGSPGCRAGPRSPPPRLSLHPPGYDPHAVPDRRFWRLLAPLTAALLYVSTWLRYAWPWFHEHFGSYPSDIWYIHVNYGWFLVHQGFVRIEYQAPLWAFVKALSLAAQHLFPATDPQKYGGSIYGFDGWLLLNAFALAPFAFGLTWCMHRLDREFFHIGTRRLLLGFLATPTFLYFSVFNYDVIPTFCAVAALLYLLRGQVWEPFLLLGVGAAFKIFPGVLVLPFLLTLPRDRWGRAVLAFVAPLAALNLPLMLHDFPTWFFPFQWQAEFDRDPQPGRPLFHLAQRLGTGTVRLALVAACAAVLLRWRRGPQPDEPARLVAVSLFLLVAFVEAKGVFSPQYLFWILPFLALGAAFPWGGRGTLLELINIADPFGLDHWRSGHMAGLVAIRVVRDLFLLGLLARLTAPSRSTIGAPAPTQPAVEAATEKKEGRPLQGQPLL